MTDAEIITSAKQAGSNGDHMFDEHPEIRQADIGVWVAAWIWVYTPEREDVPVKMTRDEYARELAILIDTAMLADYCMRDEAIFEGRQGLNEMTDDELAELGADCYDLVWTRDV